MEGFKTDAPVAVLIDTPDGQVKTINNWPPVFLIELFSLRAV
jgi:hypothetical protein